MSNWTHVSGIIRVDSFRLDPLEPDFWEKTIGKECRWDSPKEVWYEASDHGERFMPMGSEGSLHMEVWENPDESHVDAYTVSIFGDLRDHDDGPYEAKVIEWFHKACDRIEEVFCVRNAVIEVCNDWNGAATWSWCVYEEERGIEEAELLDLMYEESEAETDDTGA